MKTSSEEVEPVRAVSKGGHASAVRLPAVSYSTLSALGALYTLTLRQHLHGKRFLVLGVLFLVPGLIAALMRATAPDVPRGMLEFSLVFMLIPQVLLPLVALLYGSGIIQDEQEEQTLTYLLVRPIPKGMIYLVKLLATLTTAVVLAAVFTALTYVTVFAGDAPAQGSSIPVRCLKAMCIHGLAVAAYCCIYGLISFLTKWTLVVGFLYAAFFEVLLANMPFSIRLLSVIYYTRIIAYRSMDFLVTLPRGPKVDLGSDAWQLDVRADPGLSEHPALGTCVAIVLGACAVCAVMGAYICSRREFRVKTPEGN